MRHTLTLFFILISPNLLTAVDDSPWLTDYETAIQRALFEKKPILLSFTGSDWCIWCQKLDAELFHMPEFLLGIDKVAVPVRVNFPQRRRLQPVQTKTNRILKDRWKVDTFPTVILYDPQTDEFIWRHGYLNTKADEYLLAIKEVASP